MRVYIISLAAMICTHMYATLVYHFRRGGYVHVCDFTRKANALWMDRERVDYMAFTGSLCCRFYRGSYGLTRLFCYYMAAWPDSTHGMSSYGLF